MNTQNRPLIIGAACIALVLMAGAGSWFLFVDPPRGELKAVDLGSVQDDPQQTAADGGRRPLRRPHNRRPDTPEDSQTNRTGSGNSSDGMTDEELRERRGPTNLPGSVPP